MNSHREELIQFIMSHPHLEACFLEMIEIAKDKTQVLNKGDDAEEAVIQGVKNWNKNSSILYGF